MSDQFDANRLRGWEGVYDRQMLSDAADTIDRERALADDLAEVLESLSGLRRPHSEPDVQMVLARYREARGHG